MSLVNIDDILDGATPSRTLRDEIYGYGDFAFGSLNDKKYNNRYPDDSTPLERFSPQIYETGSHTKPVFHVPERVGSFPWLKLPLEIQRHVLSYLVAPLLISDSHTKRSLFSLHIIEAGDPWDEDSDGATEDDTDDNLDEDIDVGQEDDSNVESGNETNAELDGNIDTVPEIATNEETGLEADNELDQDEEVEREEDSDVERGDGVDVKSEDDDIDIVPESDADEELEYEGTDDGLDDNLDAEPHRLARDDHEPVDNPRPTRLMHPQRQGRYTLLNYIRKRYRHEDSSFERRDWLYLEWFRTFSNVSSAIRQELGYLLFEFAMISTSQIPETENWSIPEMINDRPNLAKLIKHVYMSIDTLRAFVTFEDRDDLEVPLAEAEKFAAICEYLASNLELESFEVCILLYRHADEVEKLPEPKRFAAERFESGDLRRLSAVRKLNTQKFKVTIIDLRGDDEEIFLGQEWMDLFTDYMLPDMLRPKEGPELSEMEKYLLSRQHLFAPAPAPEDRISISPSIAPDSSYPLEVEEMKRIVNFHSMVDVGFDPYSVAFTFDPLLHLRY